MNDHEISSILEILANGAIPPAKVNLWPRIRAQYEAPARRGLRPRWLAAYPTSLAGRLSLATVLILALAALGVLLLDRPQPVSAQQILKRAWSAASSPQTNGIHSFEMVAETTIAGGQPTGITSVPPATGETRSQLHTWYQEPDHWRFERIFLVLPNRQPEANPSVTVADGISIWSYDPEQNLLQIHDGIFGVGAKGSGSWLGMYGASGGLDAILENEERCFDPVLAGQKDLVAGRKTYRIYLGPTKCLSGSGVFPGPQTLWIDQESYFILKWQILDPNNEQIVYEMEVTQIQYNQPLFADLFTFTPPPETEILDDREAAQKETSTLLPTQAATTEVPITATPEASAQINPTITSQLPFELLLPGWLPGEMTQSIQVDGEFVTISFDSHPNDAPHDVITLREMPSALIDQGGALDPQATQEQIGSYDVMVIRRGAACMTFAWNVGDFHLQLTNPYDPPGQPRYTCDELGKVVASIH
jgi:outer membrane lipoprotein-sorting protein